jgi:hypothetical protein
MIATKIGFFVFRVHFGLLKLRYSELLFYTYLLKIERSYCFSLSIAQNVDIYSSKRL